MENQETNEKQVSIEEYRKTHDPIKLKIRAVDLPEWYKQKHGINQN